MESQTLPSNRIEGKRSIYPRKCEQCSKILKSKSTFYNHKKTCINFEDNDGICEVWRKYVTRKILYHTCEHCGRSYTYRSKGKFQSHIENCSKNQTYSAHLDCVVSDCNKSFTKIKVLARHLIADHGINCVKNISFDSVSSFEQWLQLESAATFTSFKKNCGVKIKNEINRYYCCSFYKPTVFERLTSRRNKKGTIPRDINCPVRIAAHESEGKVRIFYFSHHNHATGFDNLKFHSSKRSVKNISTDYNSEMLVPMQEIVENRISPLNEVFLRKNSSAYGRLPTTLKNGVACEKLASELGKLFKHPNFPPTMLKTMYTTLNNLLCGCQAAIENIIDVSSISNISSNSSKIAQDKKTKKRTKRKSPCGTSQNDSQFVTGENNFATNDLPSKRIKYLVLKDSRSFKASGKNECFTSSLNLTENVLDPIVFVNDYSISILELKSLDPFISDEEDNYLKSFSPHFQKGQLFDNIVNAFISKILNGSQEILFIDSIISQHVNESLSATLYFKQPINLAKYILIPTCLDSGWILVAADMTKNIFNIYDPLTDTVNDCNLPIVLKWFNILSSYFKDKRLWKVFTPKHVLQTDSLDSGVLICYYAYQLCRNGDPNESLDVLNFRNFIYNSLQNETE